MSELLICEETLLRRFGNSKTKLAAVAHRAVDWVEKHGDAEALAAAVMMLVREDVVMLALFGEAGEGRAGAGRRANATPARPRGRANGQNAKGRATTTR